MRKNSVRGFIVLVLLFIVMTVIVFALPLERNGVFYTAYLFTSAAIVFQVLVIRMAFTKGQGVRSKLYGFPIARIGIIYLIVQLAAGIIFMAASKVLPLRAVIPLEVILLAAAVAGLVATDAMRDEVERQDAQLKKDISSIRGLQSRAAVLAGQCVPRDINQSVQKFAECLKYSDPVSSEKTRAFEKELTALMDDLEAAFLEEDWNGGVMICRKAESVLSERNRICRLNKQ